MSENGSERTLPVSLRGSAVAGLGSRDGLRALQSARLLLAAVQCARQRTAGEVTVSDIVEAAGVSRRTFYENYSDREDCMLAALDEAIMRAEQRVLPAYRSRRVWRERIAAALLELLVFLDEDPDYGALLIVDCLAMSDAGLRRRQQALQAAIDAVAQGERQARSPRSISDLTAEGVVGSVLAVLHRKVIGSGQSSFTSLYGQLMSMIVLPYRGAAASARELERPRPRVRPRAILRRPAREPGDPLRDLPVRLTHRTAMVLAVVAERPESSNGEIALRAGVADHGQISRVLGRLERAGLLANVRAADGGQRNAWRLTAYGMEVALAIRAQAGLS